MNQRLKYFLRVTSFGILCVCIYTFRYRSMHEPEGIQISLFNSAKVSSTPAGKNLVASSVPGGGFVPSHLVPLRGAGDSLFPFREKNLTGVQVSQKELPFEKTLNVNPKLKKIVFWNDVFGDKSFYFGFGQEAFVSAKCRINTCFATANRTLFPPEEVDAVLWHLRSSDKSFPRIRSPHTRYVFWLLESPSHANANLHLYKSVFNWTVTYRLDSDFPIPYNIVYRRQLPKTVPRGKNYASGKTKLAAWFVSNCGAGSGRHILVKTLEKWMKVDVYGACGQLKCPRGDACYRMLERDYKFYFSFENSLCKDYVTEKSFNILGYNVIPVTYGLANYSKQLPPYSYINALDFPTAKSLADYLLYLNGNDTAYNEYFRWRTYHEIGSPWAANSQAWCDMCERLHNDNSRKVYDDIHEWFIEDSNCLNHQTPHINKFINGL